MNGRQSRKLRRAIELLEREQRLWREYRDAYYDGVKLNGKLRVAMWVSCGLDCAVMIWYLILITQL